MFATIIMNNKKELRLTTTPTIYQNENNADSILVLLPEYYGDISLRECGVTLNWIQPNSGVDESYSGDIKRLEFLPELYKSIYLQAIVPITVTETNVAGDIEIFLQIVNPNNSLDMRTGSTSIGVKSHKNISNYVPKETIDLLSDYLIKMQQISNTCDLTLQMATEQANRAKETSDLIIRLLQEWEDDYKTWLKQRV